MNIDFETEWLTYCINLFLLYGPFISFYYTSSVSALFHLTYHCMWHFKDSPAHPAIIRLLEAYIYLTVKMRHHAAKALDIGEYRKKVGCSLMHSVQLLKIKRQVISTCTPSQLLISNDSSDNFFDVYTIVSLLKMQQTTEHI